MLGRETHCETEHFLSCSWHAVLHLNNELAETSLTPKGEKKFGIGKQSLHVGKFT